MLTVLLLSCIVLFVRENKTCASGSAVEHLLAKEGVAGSIPVSRFQKEIERYQVVPLDFFFEPNPGLEGSMSPLRSGRRKAEVPRTSCDVSRFFYLVAEALFTGFPLFLCRIFREVMTVNLAQQNEICYRPTVLKSAFSN